jgi:hypothetical protein
MREDRLFKLNPAAAIERLEKRTLLSIAPMGSEMQVNSYTTGPQANTAVAMDPDGNYVVVWGAAEGAGDNYGIFARRFNAAGVAQGDEFRVNTYTTDYQNAPSVAMDADGDFVVAWNSYGQDLGGGGKYAGGAYAQRYNAAGVPQGGEFRVNTFTIDHQGDTSVAMSPSGNFVISWLSYNQDGSGIGVYAQRFDAAGIPQGTEFRLNQFTTGNQTNAIVAMDDAGNITATWGTQTQTSPTLDIEARRFDAAGNPLGNEFSVNNLTANDQFNPDLAVDADGDFVVTWQTDTGGVRIKARRYDSAGVAQGGEFAVSSFESQMPHVAMAGDGRFVIVWGWQPDGSSNGIFARAYDAAGNPRGGEFRVNSTTANNQNLHGVAMNDDGDFVVAWGSGYQDGSSYGVYAQRYAVVPNVSASDFLFDAAPHRLRFTFDENVSSSLGSSDVVLENLTTNQTIPSSQLALTYDSSTNIATFDYTGNASGIAGVLPDGSYRATLIASGVTTPNGNPLPANHVLNFFFLNGDANRDRTVSLLDFNILAANFGQSNRTFSQGNFNYDGTVDLLDFNILAARFGTSVSPSLLRGAGSGGSEHVLAVTKFGQAPIRLSDSRHSDDDAGAVLPV